MPAQKKTASSLLGAAIGALSLSVLAGILVTAMVAPAIAVTGMTTKTTIDIFDQLPSYITIGDLRQQNEIYLTDAAGTPQLIAKVFDQNRQEIDLAQMGKYLPLAAIAGEDKRYYEHGGVDAQSLLRAAIGQAGGADSAGGASTIAMQTVRNIKVQQIAYDPKLSDKERQAALEKEYSPDVGRKLQEIRLAISLDKKYSKKQILQAYLNIANFGNNTYGVQAAARQYFSVDAKDLTAVQAAAIIAIVQEPSKRSLGDPADFPANQARRDKILSDMNAQGYLTDQELADALKIPVDATFVRITPPNSGCRYADQNYALFCDYIVQSVPSLTSLGSTADERRANFARGGYKFYGTLDMAAQQVARATVQRYAPPGNPKFFLGAGVATVEPGTGRILTMAQNYDFDDASVNPAPNTLAINLTSAGFNGRTGGYQPGSTYKAFTLMAYLSGGNGLQANFNAGVLSIPGSKFKSCDNPTSKAYAFKNDAGEKGGYTVLRGTAQSVNSVFLQMATKVDQCSIRDTAEAFGMKNTAPQFDSKGKIVGYADTQDFPSCAIGTCGNNTSPLEVAAAYAGIAAQGKYCTPGAVESIIGPNGAKLPGNTGDCAQAIDANVANSAAYALQGVFKSGTAAQGGSTPRDGTPYLGKTGTTDRAFHVWTTGSSTAASTSVWVGNWKARSSRIINGGPDDQNLRQAYVGGTQASNLRHRIFRPIAEQLDTTRKGTAFPAVDPNLLKGKPTIVPDVSGLTPQAAQPLIENKDLTFADGGQIDSDQPAGTVVRTDPPAGSSVAQGTTVTVFSSNGQGALVPDVSSGKNLSFTDASTQLKSAGFGNVQQQCQSGGKPQDPQEIVVAQNPPPGTVANKSQQVVLSVQRFQCR
ncbi:MAG: transglycosylase domain-containing protein [Micrococcales bacterium]|nr:transglycosylase domain-containing protein [Micrococcales bacterium]